MPKDDEPSKTKDVTDASKRDIKYKETVRKDSNDKKEQEESDIDLEIKKLQQKKKELKKKQK
jgi:hypothetical protein